MDMILEQEISVYTKFANFKKIEISLAWWVVLLGLVAQGKQLFDQTQVGIVLSALDKGNKDKDFNIVD